MPWQLRPDELERWKSAPLPYALHAARYWQDDRSLERIFAIARQTAELEEGLHGLLKRLITSSSDQAQMLQMVPEAIDLLYRFHLVWRVPNSLIRDAMDAVWPALEGLEQRAPKELMLSFARQKWLPMAPAHLEHASWAMLLLEGILPARRMRGSLSNACRELLTLNDEQPLNALIGRIQVVAAHPRLRGSPSRLIDALPSHVFALETLAPLLRALSSIDHPRARTWCEQQYTTVGNLIAGLAPPLSLLEWHLRFQLLDGILRLGWGPRVGRGHSHHDVSLPV